MRYFIGIDFGTATSSIAYTTENALISPELIEIDGKKNINTAIRLTPDGKEVEAFGDEAWEGYQEEPNRTFVEFKMDIGLGKKYDREGFSITPEDVGLLFLRSLREKLERQFGRTSLSELDAKNGVTTVIGYPAEWSRAQKDAVKDMAKQAGFPNVEGCVEPVGVIYYHALSGDIPLDVEQKVFVYDFGGGTSDTAIVAMSKSTPPHVYDFDGLIDLGGRDYDKAIIENVFKPLFNCEQYSPADLAEFQRKAQLLKERLSNKIQNGFDQAKVHLSGLNCLSEGSRDVFLTRGEFETIEKPFIERFLAPVNSSLQQTEFSKDEIKFVIASGGSARLYFVDTLLRETFPHSSYLCSNTPQEVIAQGLALFACKAGKKLRDAIHKAEGGVVPDVVVSPTSPDVGEVKKKPKPIQSKGSVRKVTKIAGALLIFLLGFMSYRAAMRNPDAPLPSPMLIPYQSPAPSLSDVRKWLDGFMLEVVDGYTYDDEWTFHSSDIQSATVAKSPTRVDDTYSVDIDVSVRRGSDGVDVRFTFEYSVPKGGSLIINDFTPISSTIKKRGDWKYHKP